MNHLIIFVICIFFFQYLPGQSHADYTGTRDTSYTLAGELDKQRKIHPGLKMLASPAIGSVKQERNIPFCETPERFLKLDVYHPANPEKRNHITIVFIHGGGWRSGSKDMPVDLLERLAELGYVCIAPEYRLSIEALYPAGMFDVKTAIRWVRKNAQELDIDTGRIVIAGHSAGGELAAMMGATNGLKRFEGNGCYIENSSRVNAVIDLDGILAFIHPESGEGDDRKHTSAATYWFGYSKTENPELWNDASPLTHAGSQCPPFLFINSGAERMHAGRNDFIKILDHYGIYSEVVNFPDAPHSFIFFQPWADTILIKMDKFLKLVFSGK